MIQVVEVDFSLLDTEYLSVTFTFIEVSSDVWQMQNQTKLISHNTFSEICCP